MRRIHPPTQSIAVRLDRWASILRNELADPRSHVDFPDEDWDDLHALLTHAANEIIRLETAIHNLRKAQP